MDRVVREVAVRCGAQPPRRSTISSSAGIFPNDNALIRLAASVIIDQNDAWLVGHRYLSAHSLEAILTDINRDNNQQQARELLTAA